VIRACERREPPPLPPIRRFPTLYILVYLIRGATALLPCCPSHHPFGPPEGHKNRLLLGPARSSAERRAPASSSIIGIVHPSLPIRLSTDVIAANLCSQRPHPSPSRQGAPHTRPSRAPLAPGPAHDGSLNSPAPLQLRSWLEEEEAEGRFENSELQPVLLSLPGCSSAGLASALDLPHSRTLHDNNAVEPFVQTTISLTDTCSP